MISSSWLSVNRILNLVMLSCLATFGGGGQEGAICCYTWCFGIEELPGSAEGESFGEVGATIIDLTFKGLPIVADPDDTDPKDMSVVKAKLDTPAFGNAKRMLMRAKKDGASHRRIYQREFSEGFHSELVISVDPGAGTLVDGQSAGYFEVRQDQSAGEEGSVIYLRMTATWDAANQGLRVSAEDQGGPLGDSVAFPGSHEVLLSMDWREKGRFLNGTPLDVFEEGYAVFSFNDVVPVPTGVPFLMAFGAEALGKAARFYFTNLGIRSASLASGGGEVLAAMYATVALSYIELAWIYAMDGFSTDLVKANLDFGLMFLQSAKQELEAAMDKGTVHASAQTKLATRSLKKGTKRLTKGGKLADKLIKKNKSPNNALAKRANQARWEALLIQAQLFGFKSKSIDKYFDTLIVDVPDFAF